MKNRYDRLRWIPCVIIMSFLISCGGGSSSTSESTSSSINNDTNTPQTPSDTSPTKTYTSGEIAMMQQGKSIYELQCQSCHGEKGTGGTGGALTHSYDLNKLVEKITASMPTFGEKCTGSCAANVGLWIFEGFPEIKNEGATSDPTKPDPIESEPEEEKPLSPELQKGK